jgi:inosine/xanthosine triphosphatase
MTITKETWPRDPGMQVAVGSQNPVKLAATEAALAGQFDATVAGVGVDSGVSEQPRGHAETVAGAENRAEVALDARDVDLGVGIEGGVAEFLRGSAARRTESDGVAEFEGTDGLFLVMWAAVTDGERWGQGSGPALRLPETVASRIRDGEELGPVMDDLLDTTGVARDRGAAGELTNGIIDRESALKHAVAGALGPFVTDLYG